MTKLFSDVTIRLNRFRSISIPFFDQLFDLDSIQFDFFMICTPLLTLLDSCVAAWERQCCSAGHPHRCRRRRLEQGRCWVGLTDQTVWHWHGAEAAKLDSVTAHTNSIHCLMFSLAPCGQCPLSDVQTSPTLVNRTTCLRRPACL